MHPQLSPPSSNSWLFDTVVFTMIVALVALVHGDCVADRPQNIVAEASELDGEFAIAICTTPSKKPEGGVILAEAIVGGLGPFRLTLRDTGAEYCDIVRIYRSDGHSVVRIIKAEFDTIRVYRIPPGMGAEDPNTRRAEFTTIHRDANGAFWFWVVTIDTDEAVPLITVGRVRPGHPLLIPTN